VFSINKNHIKHYFIVSLSSSLLACAVSPDDDSAYSSNFSGGSDCIPEGTIRSYEVLDGQNMIVDGIGKRRYHVVLRRPSRELQSSRGISFSSPTSRICDRFSDVIVQQAGFGSDRIAIASIERLDEEQHEALRYRFGKTENPTPEPVEPEPVDGAEIEELD